MEQNIKQRMLRKIFGPLMEFLIRKGISPLFVGLILYTILLYFMIFYKRKKKKFKSEESIYIGMWFFMLFLTIISQIIMMTE